MYLIWCAWEFVWSMYRPWGPKTKGLDCLVVLISHIPLIHIQTFPLLCCPCLASILAQWKWTFLTLENCLGALSIFSHNTQVLWSIAWELFPFLFCVMGSIIPNSGESNATHSHPMNWQSSEIDYICTFELKFIPNWVDLIFDFVQWDNWQSSK